MSDMVFNIVFRGEIVHGADLAAVKTNVGNLFKANEQVLARLFSGEAIAIKKNVDKAGAMKYRALMKQAGAICYAVEPGEELPPVVAKPKPAIPTSASPATISPLIAQNSKPTNINKTIQVSSQGISKETAKEQGWSLAPVGSILVEPSVIPGVEIPDIDGISLAEVGVIIIEPKEQPKFKTASDLSQISLAPVGSIVADPKVQIPMSIPDVSGINLAPVGSDVADPVEHHYPKPPDVSGIQLAPPGSDVADPAPKIPELRVNISHIKLE